MKRFLLFVPVCCIAINTFSQTATSLLQKSRARLREHASISFNATYYWPDIAGNISTSTSRNKYVVATRSIIGYDATSSADKYDVVYIDDVLRDVDHKEKQVTFFPVGDSIQRKRKLESNIFFQFSPVLMLGKAWQPAKDTLVTHRLAGYRLVDRDFMDEGKHVVIERYLYIGYDSQLPELLVQRASADGKVGQVITFVFEGWELSRKGLPLTYTVPEGYTTRLYGADRVALLTEGTVAPLFITRDTQGRPVNLESLRGKKVLLTFSVINCGYCKKAMDHFNRSDYQFPKDVVGIYVNPHDDAGKMSRYVQTTPVPFPIVADAAGLGKLYHVASYPAFFLIDENGTIERVVEGYDKGFIDGLQGR